MANPPSSAAAPSRAFLPSLTLAALLALSAALAGCGAGGGGTVLATVDGERVTRADFERAAAERPDLAFDPSDDAKRRLLDDLIDRALLVSEAKRRGFGDDSVYARIALEARDEVLPEALYRQVIAGNVSVAESEARALWQARDREWRLSEVFAYSLPQARELRRRLAAGEPLEDVVASIPPEPGGERGGGDIGWAAPGDLPAEMERAVSRLPVGQWSEPLPAPLGYYLVLKTEERERERPEYAEAQGRLLAQLEARKERALVTAFVDNIKRRYRVELVPEGFQILSTHWQNRRMEELLLSGPDPAQLGLDAEELATPLARYDGGAYTVGEFFAGIFDTPNLQRPPLTNDPLLRLYVEDRVVNRLLLREAERRGLERDAAVQAMFRDRQEAYLINRVYNDAVVSVSRPSPEEMEQLRARLGTLGGSAEEREQLLQQLEAQEFEQRRVAALRGLLERLRREHPPVIHEEALQRVPWPLPPKENA